MHQPIDEVEDKDLIFTLPPDYKDIVKEYARKEIEQMLKIQKLLTEMEEDEIA